MKGEAFRLKNILILNILTFYLLPTTLTN